MKLLHQGFEVLVLGRPSVIVMGRVEYFLDAAESGVAPQDLRFRLGSRTKFASQLQSQLDGGQIGLHNTQGCHGQVDAEGWMILFLLQGLLHRVIDLGPGHGIIQFSKREGIGFQEREQPGVREEVLAPYWPKCSETSSRSTDRGERINESVFDSASSVA